MSQTSQPEALPLVLRCPKCGYEQSVLWDIAPPPPDPKDSEPVTATICWRGERASQEELMAMRRFVPEFRDRPMRELYDAVQSAPSWPLGIHQRSFARRIQDEARQFGLTVEIYETVA